MNESDTFDGKWEQPGRTLRPTDRCTWCGRPGAYQDGTKCKTVNAEILRCPMHGGLTDLSRVYRGRRAAIKCEHYEQGWVVLWADPSPPGEPWVHYTAQFAWPGLGQELYAILPHKGICPHEVFDKLVAEMRAGARPNPNRVPPVETV